MSHPEIPPGWSIQLDPGARRTDSGMVLIGGHPLRVLRLSAAGASWLDRVVAGDPLPVSLPSRRLARRLIDAGLANPRPPRTDGFSRRDVALVIPVRDAAEGLARTLAAVGDVGQVVVVDDGSLDAGAIRRAAPAVTVLRHSQSLGPGAARERGWRATSRPIVAFVDTDIDADGDWLTPLLAHLADPVVGAIAPRVRASRGGSQLLASYEAVRSPLDLGPLPGAARPGGRVPYVPTAALIVRRTALQSVHGFDPHLRVGEDVDLVWRLCAHGWRVRYEPGTAVRHPSRPGLRSLLRQRVRYGTSAAGLAQRHRGAVAPLRISGWSALLWLLFLLGRPLLACAVGATTTVALAGKLRHLEHPAIEAIRIAGLGNLYAGIGAADAVRRPWWPVAALLGASASRTRPALLAAAVIPGLLEWWRRRPHLDPLRYIGLCLLDDMAYGAGVWAGSARQRSARALLPAFSPPLVLDNLRPERSPRGVTQR